jgi:tetratricopeptide (TPR) repeat protein
MDNKKRRELYIKTARYLFSTIPKYQNLELDRIELPMEDNPECEFNTLKVGKITIELLDMILEVEPDDYLVLEIKGDVLTKLGKNTEALECYSRSQINNPINLLFNEAELFIQNHKFLEAIIKYDEILTINPVNIKALFKKNETLCKIGGDQKEIDRIKEEIIRLEHNEYLEYIDSQGGLSLDREDCDENGNKLKEPPDWFGGSAQDYEDYKDSRD